VSHWQAHTRSREHLRTAIAEYKTARIPSSDLPVCHAPYVSLNIEQSGKATACCYNREQILGTWPERSLAEIWEGAETAKLRAELSRDELPSGCWLCREQLLARNFGGLQARLFDPLRNHPEQKGPLRLELELSNTCNLECIMCTGYFSSSIRKNRDKLPPAYNPFDDRFVEQLAPFVAGLKEIKFLGGEPFLNPLYYKIWDLLIEKNPSIRVDITTNGTVLLEKTKRVIRSLLPNIMVSVDSLRPETYETIRKNSDFRALRKNLYWMMTTLQGNGRDLGITVCPMRINWQEMPELVSFCNRNRLHVYFNTVVNPPELSLRTLPGAELGRIIETLSSAPIESNPACERNGYRLDLGNAEKFKDLIRQLGLWRKEAELRGRSLESPPFLGAVPPRAQTPASEISLPEG
jgi:MoaA/NifB/PqqE/SkfB family radical SAM enzyme